MLRPHREPRVLLDETGVALVPHYKSCLLLKRKKKRHVVVISLQEQGVAKNFLKFVLCLITCFVQESDRIGEMFKLCMYFDHRIISFFFYI